MVAITESAQAAAAVANTGSLTFFGLAGGIKLTSKKMQREDIMRTYFFIKAKGN
jgi:hypothetical protein